MHYIRFLKLPKLTAPKTTNKNTYEVATKITITNDLGELFLTTALPLECILLVHLNQTQKQQHIHHYKWQPHARALDINLTISAKYLRDVRGKAFPCELIIRRLSNRADIEIGIRRSILKEERIIGIYSEKFGLDVAITPAATVRRILSTNGQNQIVIREEKGEEIARHIWDAGLILAEMLQAMMNDAISEIATQLPCCSAALKRKDLRAIELGTGVGLVGLSLADVLAGGDRGSARILLTDLDDAREIVEMNVAEKENWRENRANNVSVEFVELDWTKSLSVKVQDENWDVVLIADCTYNPDYAEALAHTIKILLTPKENQAKLFEERKPLAILAMKPRHAAENVFFEYMEQAGIRIIEETRVPVHVMGGESQEIRILGFELCLR